MESTHVPDLSEIVVYLGLDVGKGGHHAAALTPAGKTLHDKALANSEPKLRALFARLARYGRVLVVVDQPASIGALPVTVARDAGCTVAYLPGLTMRRIADLYPGEAKTDARDARVIADAARTMPHTLRDLKPHDETIAAHLAAYAGLAPVTRRSGSSIKGEGPALRGNRALKRALFLSAFASLAHPPSRAYYNRKISEGKRHTQALLCLARRRCDVLYAMIRNGTFYDGGIAQPA